MAAARIHVCKDPEPAGSERLRKATYLTLTGKGRKVECQEVLLSGLTFCVG
jgi:hypothetical protein